MDNQNEVIYNITDTLLVLDYYGLDENTYGWGYVGTAGQNRYNTGLVDMWWEDNDELPGLLSGVKSSGVAYHEMCHVFGSEHPAGVANRASGDVSLMYSWDGTDCFDYGTAQDIVRWQTNCSIDSVRNHIDNI